MKFIDKLLKLTAMLSAGWLGSLPANATVGALTFAPGVTYPTPVGQNPQQIALADFNEDGVVDLVVVNAGCGCGDGTLDSMSVFLGTGGGAFAQAITYTVGRDPFWPVTADFNGDGHMDIAVNNYADNNVSVFLGDGDGTFQSPQTYPAGINPYALVVSDFNGDTKPDLMVAEAYGSGVSVLLGNGDGTFQPSLHSPTGFFPTSLAPGDFNGDGILDVAVAHVYLNTVGVLLGNGDGTFQSEVSYPAGNHTFFTTAGDLNGDTYLDLVVGQADGASVSVLLGVGDGTFGPMTSYPAGGPPLGLVIGDLNGDGYPDLAVALLQDNGVSVLMGDGTGAFGPPVKFPAGVSNVGIFATDLNGDGKVDLAATDDTGSQLLILLNTSDQGNTAPSIRCQHPQTLTSSGPGGVSTVVSAYITDPDAGTLTITLKDGAVLLGTQIVTGPVSDLQVDFPVALLPGVHGMLMEVTDGSLTSECSSTVTVVEPLPLEIKQGILDDLRSLPTPTNKGDAKKLAEAIAFLEKSLDPGLWVDASHLSPKHGQKVFQADKDCVGKLLDLMKRGYDFTEVILDLVAVDRGLAELAIEECTDAKARAKALGELAKGDEEALPARAPNAIEHYLKAWQQATK